MSEFCVDKTEILQRLPSLHCRNMFVTPSSSTMTADAIRKKTITRKRDSLTCTQCRSRKLKCDKQLPSCSSCVKRGEAAFCTYSKTITFGNQGEQGSSKASSRAEERLQHLEQLVQDLIETTNDNAEVTSHSLRDSDAPVTGQRDGGRLYTGPTHHAAMLADIEELRLALGDTISEADSGIQASANDDDNGTSEMDVLFGRARSLTLDQILSKWLPPKSECDQRLEAYFRAEGIAAPFIHAKQFYRQYESFWKNR